MPEQEDKERRWRKRLLRGIFLVGLTLGLLAFALLCKLPRTAGRHLVRGDKSKKTREQLNAVYQARDDRRAFALLDWPKPTKPTARPRVSGIARKRRAKRKVKRQSDRAARRANRAA